MPFEYLIYEEMRPQAVKSGALEADRILGIEQGELDLVSEKFLLLNELPHVLVME